MTPAMTVTFPGGKRVTASYQGFEIVTDQSPKYGGEGSAPEPYDLFLAALATCAGAYVVGFCDKRGLPYHDIRLVQTWQRDEAGRLATVELTIEVPADFPERYRPALVRAASQCAVKKTLENPPELRLAAVSPGRG